MLAVSIVFLTVTGTGPKVSGNVRNQEEAFNTAEAGFEAARLQIETNFSNGSWTTLQDNCLTTPPGIDLPQEPNYFRKLSDLDIIQAIPLPATPGNGVIFRNQPFKNADGSDDLNRTFTVFLIDDEADIANGAVTDPTDALLVCIGVARSGNRVLSTSRLEIVLAIASQGTNP